jgi:c-di-GMP-binding flagellar brake protein YcgR
MADEQGVIERRQYERITAQFTVAFHLVETGDAERMSRPGGEYKDITVAHAGTKMVKDVMTVVTENISLGGLKLVTPKPIKEGSTLGLELQLPGLPLPIKALAVVVRSEIAPNATGKHTAGVRFIAINKDDVAKVERYIALVKRAEIEKRNSKP